MSDLDAYLERIGLAGVGRPTVEQVHRAHATSIPFENLDPHRGVPISLAPEDVHDKLVTRRRGGYCFEHNVLLAQSLRALGEDVQLMLGRVRYGARAGVVRPRSHLVLRVERDGEPLLADVGFGLGGLLDPLPFRAGAESEQCGWRFRMTQDGPEHVVQTFENGGWVDLYAFVALAVPPVDLEPGNWWTSTHPRSPFVTGLIVATQSAAGRTSLTDWGGELELSERTPSARDAKPVAPQEVPQLLAERFGLSGFELRDGRVTLASRA